jgi:hypothetical protein
VDDLQEKFIHAVKERAAELSLFDFDLGAARK